MAVTTICKTWIEVFSSGPRDIAKQLEDQQMVRAFHPLFLISFVRSWPLDVQGAQARHPLPIAAALGGAMLGLLSVAADLMGTIGSGTGILMAVITTIYNYWEISMRMRLSLLRSSPQELTYCLPVVRRPGNG
ncbi:hypothetical protein C8R44DRAFT_863136 [Mycena epipterygia]|nr:hypothetical protein C8R44DRAFT_863136 [Mycena epipterygia]